MLKGQLDKAIKEYQQVVALEPKENRYRQKLAELLVRDSRKDEAIAQYEDVGRHYAENSYFLKAIAVYKQIQRLSPKDTAISLTLASLNHQQGLIGNALAEYGQVVVQLEKEGDLKEAVKVLQQMLLVDGEHIATRLKLAELLLASGEEDASYWAFSALLSSLRAKGEESLLHQVSDRVDKLFPGHRENDPVAGEASTLSGNPGGISAALPPDDPALNDGRTPPHEAGELADFPANHGSGVPSAQQAAPEQAAFDSLAEIESNSASGPASSALVTPLVPETPSAFGVPSVPETPAISYAPVKSETPAELCSPWEEEIELDLGDELQDVMPQPASCLEASPGAQLPLEEDTSLVAEPYPEIDFSLDLSLSLDLEEGELSDDFTLAPEPPSFGELPGAATDASFEKDPSFLLETTVPFGEEPQETAELDLGEEDALELMLPEDFSSPAQFEWTNDAEELEGTAEELEEAGEDLEGAAGFDPSFPPPAPRQLRGWQEIYPGAGAFTDQVLDLDELESHYDLGIGYKEMGLYNEAIKAFAVAAGNPQRRLDCLTLQAICYREKGEPAKAEDLLQRGRDLEVLSSEERMSLDFELAFLLESTGAVEEAVCLYREVHKINPDFHDVARRLYSLAGDEQEESFDIIDLEMEEDNY